MKTMWLFPALVAGTISYQVMASEELSQAEIRELVREGEILPLETILAQFPPKEYGKLLDLEVLLMGGGCERTEEEFKNLLAHSGFRFSRMIPTKENISVIEGLPVY